MLSTNAQTLILLRDIERSLFNFKSPLSRDILLQLSATAGTRELRELLKLSEATPIATRLHIQSLEEDGYVELCAHETSRRCKNVRLTAKGLSLMNEYEQRAQEAIVRWKRVQ